MKRAPRKIFDQMERIAMFPTHVPGLKWAQTFAEPSFRVKCGVGVTVRETNRVNSKEFPGRPLR
jgi:hypothetical protein